ncbi:LOW QUALITY PROTEIN: tyrosine-protein phosphatase non-receptor type 23b [Clarias gariepinus]
MEAVPRMPMIWLELKEAGDFHCGSRAAQYIKKNYAERPENYTEALRKLDHLRQRAVSVTRDFEGCNRLRKYFGQLYFLQSRVPMAKGQEAAAPVTWIDIFTGKQVTHNDICYEQACVLYNLGALHSYLGTMDNRVSDEGMKTSCTHFQSAAGAFTHIRDYYSSTYSADLSHQALSINISLMLGQAQECVLEKTLLDHRKSLVIARISAQVCVFYRECVHVLESSDCVSGKKEWKKLLWMKISYFSAVTHFHMGQHCEEQEKRGQAVAYFQSALGKLNEAIKLSKGQPDSVQRALRFTMDVIGGKFNSAKKDNDFIYHESVPGLDTLAPQKGTPLVKPVPITPTDPSITGPDLFSTLVPLAAHEASSVYSEEKAKLLREVTAKIEEKNQILESFMASLNCESMDVEMFSSVPAVLLEKCAALSVQPDAVQRLVQAMQALSGSYTDVGYCLGDVCNALEEDGSSPRPAELMQLHDEFRKYESIHQEASQTNIELHQAMTQHIPNLRLLQGPRDELRKSLPQLQLSQDDMSSLETLKRLCGKVDEMRKQRTSLEKELRELIQKDDLTLTLVTTERSERKVLIKDQMQKYDQLKGYIDQNLAAQDNIIKALTEASVACAPTRKTLSVTQQQWNSYVQSMVTSYEAYEDLVKKAEDGKSLYQDMEKKISSILDKVKSMQQSRKEGRSSTMESTKDTANDPPVPAPRKSKSDNQIPVPQSPSVSSGQDVPQGLPPAMPLARGPPLPYVGPREPTPLTWPPGAASAPFLNQRMQHLAPANQPPYGRVSEVPQPMVLPQPSSGYVVPQHFQPGPSSGITPVNQNTSEMPHQGYIPSPWQNYPGVPFPNVSANYTIPPEMGQSSARPGLPGHVPMYGPQDQHMPSSMAKSSSAQQVTPGTQYQGFPQHPGHPILSQATALFGQSQPPGQFQAPVPPQSQSQALPTPAYWSTFGAHSQTQPGFPVQPQAHMGHVIPSIPSTQPQQIPGSLQNANLCFQGGTSHNQGQPLPAPNVFQQPPAHFSPMFQAGNPIQNQNQNIPPQNNSSLGPVTVPVMDNPNPPALTSMLTPSPAHPSPSNQTSVQDEMSKLSIEPSQGGASDSQVK